ncbi:MAG TPA: sigma-70 family RNA polymerase sigma factor [Mycobacterium sp.]|jgi:RNA polymerase sigma factor (sigma-70 family)|uniref:RNA polymerase sigma factor n=1 Tax=Mycobacterium sp. TaxID=1785 RepID=UPI002F40BE14
MTALPDWDIVSDAELARAAAAGDRAAFAGIYDRYGDRLHDFCVGMVRDRDAAADCVQDVFCTAAVQLPKLRDPDKLRPWLYAIARNEALRCIRQRRREEVVDELPETATADAGPDTLAARTELAALIAEAAGGLSDRDRSVLELAYRHGLDGPELAEALGVSAGNATKMVSRLRETIERSLGALLVARRAQRNPQGCAELGAILAAWDGQFSVLLRKRIVRHIDACPTCEENRRELVNPAALLGAPILIPAPWWLRGHTLSRIQLTAADFALSSSAAAGISGRGARGQHGGGNETRSRLTGRRTQIAGLGAAALLAAFMLMLAWLHPHNVSVNPADLTGTPPMPTPAASPPTPAAPSPAPPPTAAPSNPAPLPPPVGPNNTVPVVTVAPTQQPSLIQPPAPVMTQCPNGVTVPAGQSCPAPVTQCPSGRTVPAGQPCPPVTTQCPNGATVPAGEPCPAPPATARCWDGSTAPNPSKCPPQIRSWRPAQSPSRSFLGGSG